MKKGKEISAVGKNMYNMKKEKGNQYHLPFNIGAPGKHIKWEKEEGRGDGNFGEENQELKKIYINIHRVGIAVSC